MVRSVKLILNNGGMSSLWQNLLERHLEIPPFALEPKLRLPGVYLSGFFVRLQNVNEFAPE